jgi:hypothetical protein
MPCKDPIAIMDQIEVIVCVANHLSELLKRPVRARMCGHVHVCQAACAMLDDDEHVQHAQRDRDRNEEVAREDRSRMSPQEG